jgi:predicted nucleic acid-binding protein
MLVVKTVDLLVCGIAAQNGLVVLHDDRDFETAAAHLGDVRQRAVC